MAAAGQKLPACLLCLGGLKLAGWQKLPEGEERRCWQAEEQGVRRECGEPVCWGEESLGCFALLAAAPAL